MITKTYCNKCMHNEICRFKNVYEEFIKLANDMHIMEHPSVALYAKDCNDITVFVSCSHFRNSSGTPREVVNA